MVPTPAQAVHGPSSVVDHRVYPGVEEIFAAHGVRVFTGDGNRVEFALPGPRTINRLPVSAGRRRQRRQPVPGEAYRDGTWHTVLTRSGQAHPGATPQRYHFPARQAEKLRIPRVPAGCCNSPK